MTTRTAPPTLLVIVGITGDLARRKLLPAIESLATAGVLPEQFDILGVTRRDVASQEIIDMMPDHLRSKTKFISQHLHMLQMNLEDAGEYQKLKDKLRELEHSYGRPAQKLLYLSIPPQASEPVIELLGKAGFGDADNTKLLLEKPFGSDLASAKDLFARIGRYFDEHQTYHIDHYLAKEMAQNILSSRAINPLLARTWNKDFIASIDVVAAEQIGIEGRVTFYEQTGALRDFLQSHLLHLVALVLMDQPEGAEDMQPKRLTALKALHLPPEDTWQKHIVRGQYKGYAEAVGNPHTTTETFASLTLFSSDDQWKDVPITLTSGKALKTKYTEISIRYRQEKGQQPNELKLRFHPREGIELLLWGKHPERGRQLEPMRLHFTYGSEDEALAEAHEQVIYDAIHSDHSRFISSQEVLATWKLLAPIQQAWEMRSDDLVAYNQGSTVEEALGE